MSLVPVLELMSDARRGGLGLVALNVILLEHAEAIVEAAEDCGLPTVLQVSENTIKYHQGRIRPIGSACVAIAASASVPVAVHLDHATSPALCQAAYEVGFGSVMFDASALQYEDNIRSTAEVVRWCHRHGMSVEAELGAIGGKDGGHSIGARTDPAQAQDYVARTSVDALAVAVGSSHAMLERTAAIDLALVERLHRALSLPLVLHGSSGVSDAMLREAVSRGITKVNVATQLNQALTERVRSMLATEPALVDPRKYLAAAREDVVAVASRLLRLLETAS